jgi:hypothetical protein
MKKYVEPIIIRWLAAGDYPEVIILGTSVLCPPPKPLKYGLRMIGERP